MALDNNSTSTTAWAQYFDNVDGWRNNPSKASALLGAIEWLLGKHRTKQLKVDGREQELADMEPLRKEISEYVKTSGTTRPGLWGRARVQNMGRW